MSNPEKTPCLVVEDEPSLRSAVVRFLEMVGYPTVGAGSGGEALDILARQEIAVMISDIRMPGMNGVSLLKAVRERSPDTAVIMATGVSEVDTAVDCLKMGAVDYINKPFQLDEVHHRIGQAAEKRQLVLENRRYQNHLAELVNQQAARIEELFLEGIQTLVHALEAKDPYTQGHSARVSRYAGTTARTMGLDETTVQLIELGAELHDVGKIGVSEEVLNKPAKLSPEEYKHIMDHTVIGARILAPLMKNAPRVLGIVRSHHEWVNGRGLPDGLEGDAIPLEARIVSVVDAFDAMTTARSYRPGMSTEAAIDELQRNIGRQFDAGAVGAFVDSYSDRSVLPIPTPDIVRRAIPTGVAGVREA